MPCVTYVDSCLESDFEVGIPDFSAKFTKFSAKLTKLSANRKVHYSARIPTAEAYIIPL